MICNHSKGYLYLLFYSFRRILPHRDIVVPHNSLTCSHTDTETNSNTLHNEESQWSFLLQGTLTKKGSTKLGVSDKVFGFSCRKWGGKICLCACSPASKLMPYGLKAIFLILFSSHSSYQSRRGSSQYFNKKLKYHLRAASALAKIANSNHRLRNMLPFPA